MLLIAIEPNVIVTDKDFKGFQTEVFIMVHALQHLA